MVTAPPPPSRVRSGILLLVLSGLLIVAVDSGNKFLTTSLPVVQVVWSRSLFQLIVLPLLLRRTTLTEAIRPKRLSLQLLRSSLMLPMSIAFIAALRLMPQADALAIAKTSPLFIAALSPLLLREKVRAREWVGVAIGFIGALVIIRPGMASASWVMVLPLLAAFFSALFSISTRAVREDRAVTTFIYTGSVTLVVTSCAMPFVWIPPSLEDWVTMIAVGLVSGLGHLTLIQAFSRAPASLLAPISYVQLVWAAVFGFVFFGDLPDAYIIAGSVLIVGSGLFVGAAKG